MKVTITITKQELKEAMKSSDSFEQFLDICKCKYELAQARAMFDAITSKAYVSEREESSNA